ncbi:hypothetical protein [Rariglobus hedericola]|uniref:Uncharacterized protein n=1 Tax=Rariglobus hedericola TaxID=2597822 RepID=A0A556QEI4_9BACT|nr:hypothetical protein [Rariglobus hedericola]TSJ75055.1 hypothetical protein FPL22_16790 [Rariglobus hedericola]
MRPSRPLLPIRSLELPARLGRRQRWSVPSIAATDVRVRFEQSNRAVAMAARPVWLRGPLFRYSPSQPSSAPARHAA